MAELTEHQLLAYLASSDIEVDLGFPSPTKVNPPSPVEPGVQSAIPVPQFPLYAKFLSDSYFLAPHVFFQSATVGIGLYTRSRVFFSYPGFPGLIFAE